MADIQTILIVEDSRSLAETYRSQLSGLGHQILMAESGEEARRFLGDHAVDCILLDLKLPDIDGMEILRETRQSNRPPATVIITANAALNVAIEAVKLGAFDYLVKPFSAARLVTTVGNALSNFQLTQQVETFRSTVERAGYGDFIGRSLPMQRVYRTIEAAARSSASVFVTGESGTGKELAAQALHNLSSRAPNKFVALNCGAIPRDLLESTIFGHVKGAFTGAVADQEGAAARADKGTLFLDELVEMEIGLQTKLLRFIQTGTYERVGEGRTRAADIRFIAATNRDPAEAVREGRLREDLFYRLFVIPLEMPPLRDRSEDILLIARRFLSDMAHQEGKVFKAFTPGAEARLMAYSWPGNVRQLQNIIRNAVVLNDGPALTEDMLPPFQAPMSSANDAAMPTGLTNLHLPDREADVVTLAEAERQYIERAIDLYSGNIPLAARKLGISPSTIYRKKDSWVD